MERFVNRKDERAFLEEEYNKTSSALVILYGRRRVGKTALIAEFIKDKPSVYFLATEEREEQNIRAFKTIVADFLQNELMAEADIKQWDILFKLAAEKDMGKKVVIVIDEFQYLGKANPAFPSIFQRIWDTKLKDINVMVILSGSLISMMKNQTLSYDSPLYGRRTGQIKLRQIPFRHYAEFFPSFDRKKLIEFYSVTGGVPKYIELFEQGNDIYEAIEKNILRPSGFLYDEPDFLLQREVSDVGSYYSIIKTIAAGNHKLGKIAGSLEVKQTGITNYLKTLMDLDIIKREVPVTEKNPEKSKKGLYKIKDNFLLFWFKFIFPYRGMIESGHKERVMERIRNNFIDNHVSYIYEDICLEMLWDLNEQDVLPFHFDNAGRWWDNENEIDIVGLDNDGKNIIFGECKYHRQPVGSEVLSELRRKAYEVKRDNDCRNEAYILFSESGFTQELIQNAHKAGNVILIG